MTDLAHDSGRLMGGKTQTRPLFALGAAPAATSLWFFKGMRCSFVRLG
jgi:hypothetical protein